MTSSAIDVHRSRTAVLATVLATVLAANAGCRGHQRGTHSLDGGPQICDPGAARCQGNDVERCSADGSSWEILESCGQDEVCIGGECQGIPETCPSATCDANENCRNCPQDCGDCCGNGVCDEVFGETHESCPGDCGNPGPCGDGEKNGTDQCDGLDLDGETCVTQGFDDGNLSCKADCTYDTAGCFLDFRTVSAGEYHSCAVDTDGSLWCWGENKHGQIGDGTFNHRDAPTQAGVASTFRSVSAGGGVTFAVKTDGTLWGWGTDSVIVGNTPTQIGTDSDWRSASAGDSDGCALRTDGTLWYLDDANQYTASQIGAAADWKSVTFGLAHLCATKTDNTIWCWGTNWTGQRV